MSVFRSLMWRDQITFDRSEAHFQEASHFERTPSELAKLTNTVSAGFSEYTRSRLPAGLLTAHTRFSPHNPRTKRWAGSGRYRKRTHPTTSTRVANPVAHPFTDNPSHPRIAGGNHRVLVVQTVRRVSSDGGYPIESGNLTWRLGRVSLTRFRLFSRRRLIREYDVLLLGSGLRPRVSSQRCQLFT